MKVNTFSERLKEALRIRNIRQIELSEKTHIPKSAICQYLSGRFAPKQDRLSSIATVLDVSEAWLMGYDVPISRNLTQQQPTPQISDEDAKVALFGGAGDVTDEMWGEVKSFVDYLKNKYNQDD